MLEPKSRRRIEVQHERSGFELADLYPLAGLIGLASYILMTV